MSIERVFRFITACAVLALFSACQQEEEIRLRLKLSPSLNLSQYDSLQIDLIQTSDTSNVLKRLFVGSIDSMPASWPLPPHVQDGQFFIRVRGYRFEDQLGIQFYLIKQPDGQQVSVRSPVPDPVPYSRALQSIGAQSGVATPVFDTSLADTNYQVLFPRNVDTAKISPAPVDARAQLFVDDSSFTSGDTLRIPLDSGLFVSRRITVRNHRIERRYHLSLGKDSTLTLNLP